MCSSKHVWFTIVMFSKHTTLKIVIIYQLDQNTNSYSLSLNTHITKSPTREPEYSVIFFARISNYLWGWGETDEKRRRCVGSDAVSQETWCVVLNGGRSANRPATVKSHTFPRSRCPTPPSFYQIKGGWSTWIWIRRCTPPQKSHLNNASLLVGNVCCRGPLTCSHNH